MELFVNKIETKPNEKFGILYLETKSVAKHEFVIKRGLYEKNRLKAD